MDYASQRPNARFCNVVVCCDPCLGRLRQKSAARIKENIRYPIHFSSTAASFALKIGFVK